MMLLVGAYLLLLLSYAAAKRLDGDLMSFVTLPDVRALKWEVTHLDRERQAPGYWFVAPYGQIDPEEPTQKFQQYQVGPYIYDNDGMLIWAGSPLYDNRNAFDFRPTDINGEKHLSFIMARSVQDPEDRGHGIMLNQHYEVEKEISPIPQVHDFNMHEFNILPGGKTAVACIYLPVEIDMADFGRPDERSWVVAGGFAELDLETNAVIAQWLSVDHLSPHESVKIPKDGPGMAAPGYDYVHANAVDKNEAGDYIISMRFTDTIYGISGEDGHIMWRLGGSESDFNQDFTFSRQHNVKFISSEGNKHVISFVNNASDELGNQENLSSVLYVELDTTAKTARVIKRINRPDSGLTRLCGSAQNLPNDNIFICWSERGYQSEHAPNGDLLMTAQFASARYSTYRAYKSEFVGRPLNPPDVVASVYGASTLDLTTIIHVSWNGATDVAGWNFYAQAYDRGEPILIGHTNKLDFETMYIVDGYMDWITVEAVDANGTSMRKSNVQRSRIPSDWKSVGFLGKAMPTPDDPSMILASYHNSKSGSSSNNESSSNIDGMDQMEFTSYADAKEVAKAINRAYEVIRGVGSLLFLVLVVGSIGGALAGFWHCIRRRKIRSYQHVPSEEGLPTEEINLRSHTP